MQGDPPSALARELGVRRKLLYDRKKRVEQGGEESLRSRGRPRYAAGAVVEATQTASSGASPSSNVSTESGPDGKWALSPLSYPSFSIQNDPALINP